MSILRNIILNISSKIEHISPAQPCVLCGSMSHDGLWCAACNETLPYLGAAHCPNCALPTLSGEICGQCLKYPPLFSAAIAVFGYSFPLDKLIHAMKYGEQLALAEAFSEKLVLGIDKSDLPDCIIPMPLHPVKLRERGFNQSLLIAAQAAYKLDIELLPGACRRVRDTPPQSALPWKERKRNVHNAFGCDANLSGMHVALVDDVLTTGASLNALAVAVQKQGASKISAWVVARTLPHSDIP